MIDTLEIRKRSLIEDMEIDGISLWFADWILRLGFR